MTVRHKRIGAIILVGVVLLLFFLVLRRSGQPDMLRAVPAGSSLVFLSGEAGRLLDDPAFLPGAAMAPSLAADLDVLRSLWQELDSLQPGQSWPLLLHYHDSGPEGPAFGAVFRIGGGSVDPSLLAGGAAVRRTEYRGRDVFTGSLKGQPLVLARMGRLLLAGRFPFLVEEGVGRLTRSQAAELPPADPGLDTDGVQVFVRQDKLGALFGGPFTGDLFQPEGWWRLLLRKEATGLSWEGRCWPGDASLPADWATPTTVGAMLEVIPESPAFVAWTAHAPAGRGEPAASLLDPVASGELALVVPAITGSWEESDRLVIIGLRPGEAGGALEGLATRTGVLEQFEYQTFPVRRLLTGLPPLSILTGTAYAFQNPYVVQSGDYLVFAASQSALELWIDRQVVSATLARSPAFLGFMAENQGAGGAFVYGDPHSLGLLLEGTPPGRWLASLFSGYLAIGGFAEAAGRGTGWHGRWPLDTAMQVNSEFLWRRRLEAPVGGAPQVVRWADGETTIAATDERGTFYLLDATGEVRWTVALDGPVFSRIALLDYYGDGQQQMLFNTRHSVYLLDRSGRPAGAYPWRLQSPAMAGLTLVEFSGPGDYGIFIPCANGSIFGFSERQLPLPGWNPGDSLGATAGSVLHFQYDNKDFLVALGTDGILRAYDRQGRLRFPPDTLGAAAISPPAVELGDRRAVIAAADRQGGVLLHRPGRSPSRLRLRTQANPMWFAFADVTGDERRDYIAVSGRRLTVHAYQGGRLRRAVDRRLPVAPDTLFTVAVPGVTKQRIGTLKVASRQIHLFDGEGRLLPGFPLAGATAFTVVDLFGDGRRMVVVGAGDEIYAYVIGAD